MFIFVVDRLIGIYCLGCPTPQGFTIDGEIEEGEDYREQLIFVEGKGIKW